MQLLKFYVTIKENNIKMIPARRATRIIAVQVIYAIELGAKDTLQLIADAKETHQSIEIDEKMLNIILSTIQNKNGLMQKIIKDHISKNWRIERINTTNIAILKSALSEIINIPETPTYVIIAEYVQIAQLFTSSIATKFVNGFLTNTGSKLRTTE